MQVKSSIKKGRGKMSGSFRYGVGTVLTVVLIAFTARSQTGANYVDGNLITFTNNGAWCWFQDERAVVDTVKHKLVVGSTNSNAGVDVVIYDINSKKIDGKKAFNRLEYLDDHNAPGLCIAGNGNYVAMWCHHYDKYNTHYSIFNGSQWSAEKTYDWNKIPGGTDYTIAYSNVYYLSDEKRMFDFARANSRAPNFLYSDDNGNTWQFGGQLTTNSSNTYNKGYYKYWGNGKDRIDMVFTEEHPRDQTTSIYHGYITGGKTYSSDGKVADADIYERQQIPTFDDFTKVFAHNTKVNGVSMGRCWQSDLMRYNDGTIGILFKARADNSETDHRNFYARYDGTEWKSTYIGKAGGPMYAAEQDYTGLGALSPDDQNRIYISSPYNPGDDASTPKKREIWRGSTADHGATWEWEPVTANSSQDNFRPVVPQWKPGKEAVLWFRGTYTTAQNFSTNIVGLINEYTVGTSEHAQRNNRLASAAALSSETRFGVTSVQYTVPQTSAVSLQLFSAAGKPVKTLVHGKIAAGTHRVCFSSGNLPAGVYFCRLTAPGISQVISVNILIDLFSASCIESLNFV
ncbi:MAG: hypothetical protein JXA18_12065 [Chitinispirillaceae bacterium]|nr:hypothetical protein [Chitinispirillaceae bacterium]